MKTSSKMDLDLWLQEVGYTSSVLKDSHAHVNGHLAKVSNPIGRFSISAPLPGGCGTIEMVKDTAKRHNPKCVLAADAGYYTLRTTPNFDCIGNVVTDGKIVQTEEMKTATVNFGVHLTQGRENGPFQ